MDVRKGLRHPHHVPTSHANRELRVFTNVTRLRFVFASRTTAPASEHPGALWRSVLGAALRSTVCETGLADCRPCPRLGACTYPALFLPADAARANNTHKPDMAPAPYALRATRTETAWQIDLHLFGNQHQRLPLLIQALHAAGIAGLGKHRVPATLQSTHVWDAPAGCWVRLGDDTSSSEPATTVPPRPAGPITLHLQQPLRLQRNGRLIRPRTFAVADLFVALARRHHLLHTYYGIGPGPRGGLPAIPDASVLDLAWEEPARYSARQQQTLKMGGIVGTVRIDDAEALAPWWPSLWTGQALHIGRLTTMGLGAYQLTTSSGSA